jgi:NADPH:quinone reductase-like Zn-dependent oxidoreductase
VSFPTATVPGSWIRPGSASRQNGWVGASGYDGQRGRACGTAAEYIALDAGLIAPLPDNTPFDAGACPGIPRMSAHRCLFADGPIAGQTIPVTGGAGGTTPCNSASGLAPA